MKAGKRHLILLRQKKLNKNKLLFITANVLDEFEAQLEVILTQINNNDFAFNDYLHYILKYKRRIIKAKESILADVFEAMVGAIYLDRGFLIAKKFLEKKFEEKIPYIFEKELYLDPKSRFQEMSQEIFSTTPHYHVLKESGPDHNKEFTVGVYIGDDLIAEGSGGSKQIAQVEAAKAGLVKKEWV